MNPKRILNTSSKERATAERNREQQRGATTAADAMVAAPVAAAAIAAVATLKLFGVSMQHVEF